MNKQTYEALKRVIITVKDIQDEYPAMFKNNDINQVESWIDEVSKEYQEGGEQE